MKTLFSPKIECPYCKELFGLIQMQNRVIASIVDRTQIKHTIIEKDGKEQ